MRKSVGIITFHASHNYGSMLQAYALQQVILGMGFDCEIINFRTMRQKKFYMPIFWQGNGFGKIKRTLFYLPFCYRLIKKYQLFERFLHEELVLSNKEYATLEELEEAGLHYDCYISGSDQIWNTSCFDFDWAYFLPFVTKGEKMAYAPSMGPTPLNAVSEANGIQIRDLLAEYDVVSVREQKTAMRIKQFSDLDCPVMLDPSLLLPSYDWSKKAGEQPLIQGKYIFFYAPHPNMAAICAAKKLSKQLGLPVVVSQLYGGWKNNLWVMDRNFHLYLTTGPNEFLNLCKHAVCTIGCSFHLVAFSILLHTPFFAVSGMADSRVANLLSLTRLDDKSLDLSNQQLLSLDTDFNQANQSIEEERQRSLLWLKQHII